VPHRLDERRRAEEQRMKEEKEAVRVFVFVYVRLCTCDCAFVPACICMGACVRVSVVGHICCCFGCCGRRRASYLLFRGGFADGDRWHSGNQGGRRVACDEGRPRRVRACARGGGVAVPPDTQPRRRRVRCVATRLS
jgi:hypothetical protein